MHKQLLLLLVCPDCKKKLVAKGNLSVRCVSCSTIYPIKYGIPVLVNLKTLPTHLVGQIRYFDAAAKTYSETYSLASWQKKYIDRLEACLGTYKKKIIVDNASGSGYVTLAAANLGATVISCDLNFNGLMYIRKMAKKLGVEDRVLTVCCSSESLPIASNVAHATVANAILEHLPKEKEAVADITRISKKGAFAMITVPLAYHLLNPLFLIVNIIHDKQIGHLRRYTAEMLQKRFRGWKVRGVYYTGHTAKVLMTLFNVLIPIFNEESIEKVDEKSISRKLFASNISVLFRKN